MHAMSKVQYTDKKPIFAKQIHVIVKVIYLRCAN